MAAAEANADVKELSRYDEFVLLHGAQLRSSDVPEHFWPTLVKKLDANTFDAGDAFLILEVDYEGAERPPCDPMRALCATKDLRAADGDNIFLIDHMWTYRLSGARDALKSNPALCARIAKVVGCAELTGDEAIDAVLSGMWRHNQTYNTIAADEAEDRVPVWYFMDEFGCSITHSDLPNIRVVPFVLASTHEAFSLLFPIEDVGECEQVVRDYGDKLPDCEERRALLHPWYPESFTHHDFEQTEPKESYFLLCRVPESLPADGTKSPPPRDGPLRVYTEYPLIATALTSDLFEVVGDENEADILWFIEHFRHYRELAEHQPHKYVNQFPYENVITAKDLLAAVGRRTAPDYLVEGTLDTKPTWLPTTFNLSSELVKFVSYYQTRDEQDLDNHWIIKPWNLARSLDTHVTNDLNQILRLQTSGPKMAQKYIDRPVLFTRPDTGAKVKFDLRFMLLVKSVGEPAVAHIYSNFFVRFANKPFALDQLDEYEKHFTVMNYGEHLDLFHMKCDEFLELWRKEYPMQPWMRIEEDIRGMLALLMRSAVAKPPPMGIGHSPQSRAVYAADIMLEWTDFNMMRPKLLEINYMPDCKRACDYYPDFFNDIFKLLFLDIENKEMFKEIPDLRYYG